jgi:serine/threonine-protein kinase RsbW
MSHLLGRSLQPNLRKLGDAGGSQIRWLGDAARTDFRIVSSTNMEIPSARFQAKIEQLHDMLDWIKTQLKQLPFDEKVLQRMELASEEAIVNVIRHGRVEIIEIAVRLFPKKHAEIIFRDFGPPFNPLTEAPPVKNVPLPEREIGGLGIYFMRRCVDEVRYFRESSSNVLTLIKKVKK